MVNTNNVSTNKPVDTIRIKYLFGQPPKKEIIKTKVNKIAAVEKLAGKIKATTIKTGSQRGRIVFENEITSSFIFAKYLTM